MVFAKPIFTNVLTTKFYVERLCDPHFYKSHFYVKNGSCDVAVNTTIFGSIIHHMRAYSTISSRVKMVQGVVKNVLEKNVELKTV